MDIGTKHNGNETYVNTLLTIWCFAVVMGAVAPTQNTTDATTIQCVGVVVGVFATMPAVLCDD